MSTTIYIELGDTEFELEVDYEPGTPPGWDDAGSGPEVYLHPLVRFSNKSGWEVTTLGNFVLDYAGARGLSVEDGWRCLEEECAQLAADKLEADYESRWDL